MPIGANTNALTQLAATLRTKGLLTLPPGASEQDLEQALGLSPLRTFWEVASDIFPAPGADRKDTWHMDKQDLEQIGEVFEKGMKPSVDELDKLKGTVQADKKALEAKIATLEAAPPSRTWIRPRHQWQDGALRPRRACHPAG